MKNILVLLMVTLLFVQCKKDDDSSITDIINPTASMSAKINGTAWSAVTRVTTIQVGKFIITGTGTVAGNDVMAITIFDTIPGTYNLDPMTSQIQFAANFTPKAGASTDSIYTAYQGSVVISSVDNANKKLSGTYSFKMRLTDMITEINVTEGAFSNLSYTR